MKHQKVRKIISFISSLSLVMQSFLPLTIAMPVYAEGDATDSAIVEVSPTPEITPEPTVEPTPNASPTSIVDPTPEATQEITPETSPTLEPTVEVTQDATSSPEVVVNSEENIVPEISPEVAPEVLSSSTETQNNSPPAENTPNEPTVSTDKADYAPTDTVQVAGMFFLANTPYVSTITSEDAGGYSNATNIITDETGAFFYLNPLDGTPRLNYSLEVIDISNTTIASTTFTDTPPTCTLVEGDVEATEDLTTNPYVVIDFSANTKSVDISAQSGYTITSVWLDYGNGNGYILYGTIAGTYSPLINDHIVSVKVHYTNGCSTPTPYCGDGIVNQSSESCDGTAGVGTHQSCSSTCTLTNVPYCGDGLINQSSEECDDNNSTDRDGCNSTCQVENRWSCSGEPSVCTEGKIDWCHCEPNGNCQTLNLPHSALQNAGHMNASGNPLHAGDYVGACTSSCTDTDDDGICDSQDNCTSVANPDQADSDNDGVGDTCDNCARDANPNQEDSNGDGVGDVCTPVPICGDNIVNQTTEACDDGNLINGDGCSDSCQDETDDSRLMICHATSSDTNPYNSITISYSAVVHAHINHQDTEDIIPPFIFNDQNYSQNWPSGQATWNNGCVAPSGSIQGKKFEDKNHNGTRQNSDSWLNGWTINLYKEGDGWQLDDSLSTGHTGVDGQYKFDNVEPGRYLVCEDIKDGWMQTGLIGDFSQIQDPNNENAQCFDITLGTDQDLTGLQFGNFELGEVMGKKFEDVDGDGKSYESGESFLNGWGIRLYNSDWQSPNEVTTSNTGILGQYKYSDLTPGTYYTCEVSKSGWSQTWPRVGDVPIADNGTSHAEYGTAVANGSGANDEEPICWRTVISTSNQQNSLLRFGNHQDEEQSNPTLTISKSNDASGSKNPGGSVTYTIVVKAQGGTAHNVKMIDLLPAGFKYRVGSYTSSKLGVGEPTYASPGTWNLGTLNEGDEVTLTLIADISSDQNPGTYKDLALAYGCNSDEVCNDVIASAVDPGIVDDEFVGTEVEVIKDQTNGGTYEVEKTEGQVLGASTSLPATGASPIWLMLSFVCLVYGVRLIKSSNKSK